MSTHRLLSGLDLHEPYHYVQETDPGSVGAKLYWLQISTGIVKRRNNANNAWIVISPPAAGVTTFTGLSDTPADYTGQAAKLVAIKSDETGLEFVTAPNSAIWGSITGTLGSQTDLASVLSATAPISNPTFTGVPAAPTPASGTNTTQIATTAFVSDAVSSAGGGVPYLTTAQNRFCKLWLDCSDITTAVLDTSSKIVAMVEKSKLGQVFNASAATLVYGATQNGLNTVAFAANGNFSAPVWVTGNQPHTIFFVFRPKTAALTVPWAMGTNASVQVYHLATRTTNTITGSTNSFIAQAETGTYVTNTPYVVATRYNQATNKIWLNTTAGTSVSMTSMNLGATAQVIGSYLDGSSATTMDFMEMVGIGYGMTDTEITTIINSLKSKWGI